VFPTRRFAAAAVTAAITGALAVFVTGCGPRESRDIAGARTEINPPKTEDFLTKVNAIQPGTRRDVVRHELGDPDELRRGFIDPRPEPGPAADLTKLAPANTRYEDWIYKRGDSHYHVFFTRGTRAGTTDWEVLVVKSMPKDAVY
jgi:hypothetical protein